MNERPNWEVVLSALQEGVDVKINSTTYRLIKAGDPIIALSGIFESDHDVLCHVMYQVSGEVKKELTFPAEIPINDFIKLCDDLTEEERFTIIASKVLREHNRERY